MTLFRKRPRAMLFLFTLTVILLILLTVESALRLIGTQPGYSGNAIHFNLVDSLLVDDDYIADEYGVNRVRPDLKDTIESEISKIRKDLSYIFNIRAEFTLQELVSEYSLLQYREKEIDSFVTAYFNREDKIYSGLDTQILELLTRYKTPFYEFISHIEEQHPDSVEAGQRAYVNYAYSPLNREGFRSIEFEKYPTGKLKILLLGDSFTWGLSAQPLVNSFADRLAMKDFIVFNTGIVGSDPAQYLAVAEQYIPKLQPDVVCVNYFPSNDDMHFYREVKPYQLNYYPTSAGWLWSCPKGEYLPDAKTAYQYYQEHSKIPERNFFNRLCAKTVLSTKLWHLLVRNFIIQGYSDEVAAYNKRNRNFYIRESVSETYLKKIKAICDTHNAKFLLAIIPDYKKLDADWNKELNIKELPFFVPENLTVEDYNEEPDGHFNNSGHEKYANFLEKLIGN